MEQDYQPRVVMRRGALEVNDQPLFLFGGEIHYFRLDPDEWERRVRQMKAAHMNVVATYVPWLWHEPHEGLWDFTGETHPRRNLRRFLEICHEFGMYVFVRPGPYVMAELLNAGIPSWLLDDYPEVIARTEDGRIHPTNVVTYTHPVFIEFAKRWLEHVGEEIRPFLFASNGPIILYQIDNEVGMLHWVSNQADYHPEVLKNFSLYHGDIDGLSTLKDYWKWQEYQQELRQNYVQQLMATARKFAFDTPFIVNVHGFKDFSVYSRGMDYPIGLAQLIQIRELNNTALSGDFYPGKIGLDNFHDLVLASIFTTSSNRDDALRYSAEFQSGRLSDKPYLSRYDIELATRLVIAHGLNGVNYYMFSGGDNPEGIGSLGRRHDWQAPISADGHTRSSYDAISELGELFACWGSQLVESELVHDLAISFYTPYYLTDTIPQNLLQNPVLNSLIHQRTQLHFDGIYRILSLISVGIYGLNIHEVEIDAKYHPTLWVASTSYMDAQTQKKLYQYVMDGGQLIIGPGIPLYDLEGNSCTILADAFEIVDAEEYHVASLFKIFDDDSILSPMGTVFSPPSHSQVVGIREVDGKPCVASWKYGRGTVTVVGIGFSADYFYQTQVVKALLAWLNIQLTVQVSTPFVHASLRRGPSGSFLSLINPSDEPCLTWVMTEQWPETLSISVPARQGMLLPLQVPIDDDVLIQYSTAEIIHLERRSHAVTFTVRALGPGQLALRSRYPLRIDAEGITSHMTTDTQEYVLSWTVSGIRDVVCQKIETF
ncbi:beta-galactosidase [Sulfobacillus thermosulfidooxidans]|uniref:beta-galactosidase n=1 Tax=Sulfobacillus thermosulfidooxidans TaxID=28034 RepID=UPI0002D9ECB9|nr:beta-galactosidase [Sulfobacillus thermosulfidooxidans]